MIARQGYEIAYRYERVLGRYNLLLRCLADGDDFVDVDDLYFYRDMLLNFEYDYPDLEWQVYSLDAGHSYCDVIFWAGWELPCR